MPSLKHTILIALLFSGSASAQRLSMKESSFQLTVGFVSVFLEKKDSVKLSRYIDKSRGIYILYTIGVSEDYRHYKTLGFSDTTYPNYPFYDGIIVSPPVYASLPTYDCEKEWSKTGTFVDTTRTDHLLSGIAKRINEITPGRVSEYKIRQFYELENQSRRVVIVNKNTALIFYLSYLKDRWVLTIIDKATYDCSV